MKEKNSSGFSIMMRLLGLVRPLTLVMIIGIILGTLGHLCGMFVGIIGAHGIILALAGKANPTELQYVNTIFLPLIIVALLRGVFHYGEQYCNHYIAFRILAIIRHRVFAALRRLCPAKLEGSKKGNLITMITTDIELLEVFFAHTVSPIAIAILCSVIMTAFIGIQFWPAAILAAASYILVGALIPIANGRESAGAGLEFREEFADYNSYVLATVYGVDDTIQYADGDFVLGEIAEGSDDLATIQEKLSGYEKNQRSLTNLVIQGAGVLMLLLMFLAYSAEAVTFEQMIINVVAMMGSFGPVVALSSLSNNLNQTLASGKRVLDLLDEAPAVEEVTEGVGLSLAQSTTLIRAKDVTFSYEDGPESVLNKKNISILKGKVLGIHGASGCGKSTFLRLLMRFWDVDSGKILFADAINGPTDIQKINTQSLRKNQSFVTQDTWISRDTIANNIAVGRPGAKQGMIVTAAKMANIHDFIMSLPEGYDTEVGELGSTLSDGEKQRIGLARAFLHNAPIMLLDEPTSSLDALNEGIILRSLKAQAKDKTIVLVSHRKSTMRIADSVIDF